MLILQDIEIFTSCNAVFPNKNKPSFLGVWAVNALRQMKLARFCYVLACLRFNSDTIAFSSSFISSLLVMTAALSAAMRAFAKLMSAN